MNLTGDSSRDLSLSKPHVLGIMAENERRLQNYFDQLQTLFHGKDLTGDKPRDSWGSMAFYDDEDIWRSRIEDLWKVLDAIIAAKPSLDVSVKAFCDCTKLKQIQWKSSAYLTVDDKLWISQSLFTWRSISFSSIAPVHEQNAMKMEPKDVYVREEFSKPESEEDTLQIHEAESLDVSKDSVMNLTVAGFSEKIVSDDDESSFVTPSMQAETQTTIQDIEVQMENTSIQSVFILDDVKMSDLYQKGESVDVYHNAHEVFDEMTLKGYKLQQRKMRSLFVKSWMFKFKLRPWSYKLVDDKPLSVERSWKDAFSFQTKAKVDFDERAYDGVLDISSMISDQQRFKTFILMGKETQGRMMKFVFKIAWFALVKYGEKYEKHTSLAYGMDQTSFQFTIQHKDTIGTDFHVWHRWRYKLGEDLEMMHLGEHFHTSSLLSRANMRQQVGDLAYQFNDDMRFHLRHKWRNKNHVRNFTTRKQHSLEVEMIRLCTMGLRLVESSLTRFTLYGVQCQERHKWIFKFKILLLRYKEQADKRKEDMVFVIGDSLLMISQHRTMYLRFRFGSLPKPQEDHNVFKSKLLSVI
ncbi:unnamed protein product [Cochlearia groenlandica]